MNLNKSYEFFAPDSVADRIHIIGCGSVGSTIAENLARFGITKMTLYDFDTVEEKNIVNQMFTSKHVGKPKVEALADILCEINPEIKDDLVLVPEGYSDRSMLSGYVFLAVDNIDLRREIAQKYKGNPFIKAMFDFRTRLTDAQHYAADWSVPIQVESFLNSMDFSSEEAEEATEVSACGTTLGVAPTVRLVVGFGVTNFLNFVRGGDAPPLKKMILVDAFAHSVVAF